ncbi:hypothetical protein BMS3Bbin02_01037 [bacterium BMS3Bbin02]|nr:hypothetical protein BMS3Bbin02_01037 [bacterium BMS3Bbin02]
MQVAAGPNGRLPGEHSSSCRKFGHSNLGPEAGDHIDEFKCSSRCSLGIVLVGGFRTPHTHDGVTNELVGRSPITSDNVTAALVVRGQHGTNILGIAVLGERCVTNEVCKHDRNKPPFRDAGSFGLQPARHRAATQLRSTVETELVRRTVCCGTRGTGNRQRGAAV